MAVSCNILQSVTTGLVTIYIALYKNTACNIPVVFVNGGNPGVYEMIALRYQMRIAADKAGYTADFIYIEEETLKEALDNDSYDVVMPFGSAIPSAAGYKTIVSDNLFRTPFTLVTEEKLQKTL